jgi:hypothetical protein
LESARLSLHGRCIQRYRDFKRCGT